MTKLSFQQILQANQLQHQENIETKQILSDFCIDQNTLGPCIQWEWIKNGNGVLEEGTILRAPACISL